MIKELKNHKANEYIKEIKDLLNYDDFWLDNIKLRKEELGSIIDYIDKLELEHKKMSKRFRNSKSMDKDKYLLKLIRIIMELLETLGYEDIDMLIDWLD